MNSEQILTKIEELAKRIPSTGKDWGDGHYHGKVDACDRILVLVGKLKHENSNV